MHNLRAPGRFIVSLFLLLAVLTGCGQKGPLFLPDKVSAPAPAKGAQAPDGQPSDDTGDKNGDDS